MKKMSLKTLSVCTSCLVLVLVGIIGIGSKAGNLTFLSTGDVVTQDGKPLFAVDDLTTLDNKIEAVSGELTALETSVGNNKTDILNALSINPNLNVEPDATFADITTYIQNMSTVPADTYFYEDGTEGGEDTIVRYKKVDGEYYVCDANGIVAEGTSATDVTSKTLVEYGPTAAGNLSAGSAGYASNSFLLGNGSDNAAYVEQGYREGYTQGVADGLSKVNIQYTYHTHEGSEGTTANGCYTKAVKHAHVTSCYKSIQDGIKSYSSTSKADKACYSGYTRHTVYIGVTMNSGKSYSTVWICPSCGLISVNANPSEGNVGTSIGKTWGTYQSLICNKSTSTIDKYTIGCGKTTDTIESATIIY